MSAAVIYAKAGDGSGIARQVEACRRFAADRGIEVGIEVEVHGGVVDPTASLIATCRQAEATDVVTYALDRVARRTHDLERLIEAGLTIHTVVDGLDLATAESLAVARIMLAIADHETARLAVRRAYGKAASR